MNLIINFLNFIKLLNKKKIFLIVFLGPDGSGKSSLINKLIEECKCYGSNHYSHFYPYFNKNPSKTKIYPYSKRPYSTLLSNIKVIYMLLKNIYNLVLTSILLAYILLGWISLFLISIDQSKFPVLAISITIFFLSIFADKEIKRKLISLKFR